MPLYLSGPRLKSLAGKQNVDLLRESGPDKSKRTLTRAPRQAYPAAAAVQETYFGMTPAQVRLARFAHLRHWPERF